MRCASDVKGPGADFVMRLHRESRNAGGREIELTR